MHFVFIIKNNFVALPVFQDTCTAAELAMLLCSQVLLTNLHKIKVWNCLI